MKFTFDITGMHCASCAALIQEELEDAGATHVRVAIDPSAKHGVASGEHRDPSSLAPKIESLGEYSVRRIA